MRIHPLAALPLAAFFLSLESSAEAQGKACAVPAPPPVSTRPVHPARPPAAPACAAVKGGCTRPQVEAYNTEMRTYNAALEVYQREADTYLLQLNRYVNEAQAYTRCEVAVLNAEGG